MVVNPASLNPTATSDGTSADLSTRLAFLKQVPIFQDIGDESWLASLAEHLEEAPFPAGQTILHQGEAGHLLYLLLSGKVQVHLDGFPIAQLEAGAFFGEMALFDSQPRSASVTALEDSRCLLLTQAQIDQAIQVNPAIALNIIRVLTARVRSLNRLFGACEDVFISW
jgi:CRP-like cAMP-binding protein